MNALTYRLAWLQRFTALAIVAFWTSFWLGREHISPNVMDFELNFVLPDCLWLVGLLVCSSRWLISRHRYAVIASAAVGGAMIFLGLLDVIFNIRHSQYTGVGSTGLLNAAINAGCIIFGFWNLYVAAAKT